MAGGSIGAAMSGGRAHWRLLAASLLAAFVLSLSGWNEAHACPTGAKSPQVAAQHKLKSNPAIGRHVVTAVTWTNVRPVAVAGHCCGGSSASADPVCKSGCCSAGVAMADLRPDGLVDVHPRTIYSARAQDQLTSIHPPAHFRPPQSMV
jgi:hypothetical protein